MTIKINKNSMSAGTDGSAIATATRNGDRRTVSTWRVSLTGNQAITARTLTERLATGCGKR